MTHEERIAKEEEYWDAPKLFGLGLGFLTAAIIGIYGLACL